LRILTSQAAISLKNAILVSDMLRVTQEKERSNALLQAAIPIGVELTAETDYNRLLERILVEAQAFCDADAGILYLRREDERREDEHLEFDSLGVAMGGTTGHEIPFPPVPLYDPATGEPNQRRLAAHVALQGVTVNIRDAYQAEDFDFSAIQDADAQTGYHSTSVLTVPLKNNRGQAIGVLQLINARAPGGAVGPFDTSLEPIIESLAALAATALQAYRREQSLRAQIEELRIEIDESKKASEVAAITETDYFHSLQEKARRMRAGSEHRAGADRQE
jgi:GAF domain-containing protein